MTSDNMFALTPLRLPAGARATYRRSVESVSPLRHAAARGVDTSLYFADERGVNVLAPRSSRRAASPSDDHANELSRDQSRDQPNPATDDRSAERPLTK
jgi:hypothetical protein